MGAEERTEEATPRRREEARKKGQVARTKELPSTLLLLSTLLFFYLTGKYFYSTLRAVFVYFLSNAHDSEAFRGSFYVVLYVLAKVLFPLFLLLVAIGMFSYVIQFGFLFTMEPLSFKWDRLNPFEGIKNLFSKRIFVELFKAFLKMVIVLAVAYPILKSQAFKANEIFEYPVNSLFFYFLKVSGALIFKLGLLFLFISLLDYGYQRWEHEQSLKMTRQEVKEELKQQEGDPLVKSRIRRIQRELARKRMMQEVPKADVVITNPVEIAVALKYDEDRMEAPMVVAKGAGELAKRIREIARKHGVPIVENRPLARMLYKMVEVGEEIPEALYRAVAEVLAFVYKMRGRTA